MADQNRLRISETIELRMMLPPIRKEVELNKFDSLENVCQAEMVQHMLSTTHEVENAIRRVYQPRVYQ